jgi:hypothetical protein
MKGTECASIGTFIGKRNEKYKSQSSIVFLETFSPQDPSLLLKTKFGRDSRSLREISLRVSFCLSANNSPQTTYRISV